MSQHETKLWALRAAGAFRSPKYYSARRRTLTKPLMLVSPEGLLEELRALAYICLKTNRALIVPNVLVGIGLDTPGQPTFDSCRSFVLREGTSVADTVFCRQIVRYLQLLGRRETARKRRESRARRNDGRLSASAAKRSTAAIVPRRTSQVDLLERNNHQAPRVHGERYWPGFRVLFSEVADLR